MTTLTPKHPRAVQVGSVRYTIEWVDSSVMDKPKDIKASPQRWGDCNSSEARIRIATDLALTVQKLTLWHEIGHAICNIYGGDRHRVLRAWCKEKRRDTWVIEETYTMIFEHAREVMRDNPKVMAWILSD